jgi:hypothetical protein
MDAIWNHHKWEIKKGYLLADFATEFLESDMLFESCLEEMWSISLSLFL